MRRLVEIEVEGLLGRFDHLIEFPEDWEFVIVHGPNGIGKTKILELTSAVFASRFARVLSIPFSTARFVFSDGSSLRLDREGRQLSPAPSGETSATDRVLSIELSAPSVPSVQHTVWLRSDSEFSARMVRDLERRLPVERAGPDEWFDHRFGDRVSTGEIVERYSDDLPQWSSPAEQEEVPAALQEFLGEFKVHLIETQRLLMSATETRGLDVRRSINSRSTVRQYSQDLARRIAAALAENSRRSQNLDKSFPRRVLFDESPPQVSEAEIRERYLKQLSMRSGLARIGVLDKSPELDLPDRELEDWEERVLWVYLEDTDEKLKTFDWLSRRITLLQEILNSRLQFKKLNIDLDRGFVFTTDEGADLSASMLSSGEQHELVLFYGLLFNSDEGTLVLIDEPEISLHVAWQREFLNDIRRVADLASLRFIVATHSPQIVDRWVDRATPLLWDDQLNDYQS